MHKEVTIPFQPEWKEKMLSGVKTCTSRTKSYGSQGDTFQQFGSTFRILSVMTFPLEYVAKFLHRKEGCNTPEEFKEIWIKLHRRKRWVPEQIVFTHFFRRE